MPPITLLYIFLAALFTVLILIPPISTLAVTIGILDKTDERKVHVNDTPRLGGIAIFFAFCLAFLLFGEFNRQTRGFLAGAMFIFLTGLADDLTGLSPRKKLSGETMAALAAVMIGGIPLTSLGDLFGLGDIRLGIFAIPFTVVAIVGVTNAVNLLDGLDGLAAGVCAVAASAMGVLAYLTGNQHLLCLVVALLGALIGFLKYNSYPAKIFMGDGGSLFLGYCMGFFSVLLVAEGGGRISAVTPLIILAVPILDTLFVVVKRLRSRQCPFSPDRNHIHHRILDVGVSHRFTVIMVYGFTYVLASLAVLYHRLPGWLLVIGLVVAYLPIYVTIRSLAKRYARKRSLLLGSNRSFRDTRIYRRITAFTGYLMTVVKYFLIAVLLLSAFALQATGRDQALVSFSLLFTSLILIFMTKDWGNRFLRFVLYFDGAFIIYQLENWGRTASFFTVPLLSISHLLFLLLFAMVGVEVFLRRRTRKLMNSPLEYLILFIILSVPLLPDDFTGRYHLLTVAGKSVILFAAYRLILMHQANRNRKIILATLIALLVVGVKGIL